MCIPNIARDFRGANIPDYIGFLSHGRARKKTGRVGGGQDTMDDVLLCVV